MVRPRGDSQGVGEAPRLEVAFFDFELSASEKELRRRGVVRPVEPRVFRFLEYLIAHADRVVPKDEVLRELWHGEAISAGVLSQCLWAARRAVDDDGDKQQVIKTVHGVGYRFVAPLRDRVPQGFDEPAEPSSSALVGREQELAVLLDDLRAARLGHGRLRLVLGEPGIGKTHLSLRLAVVAREHGFTVLGARCFAADGMPPYTPWAQLVEALCASSSVAELSSIVRPGTADLAEVAPALRALLPDLPSVPPLGAAQARLRLFNSFTTFIQDVAALRPLVIVIEDLHAADEPSLSLLERIASSISTLRVLIVVTQRAEQDGRGAAQQNAARLLRCPGAQALTMHGLSREETLQLIALHQGAPLSRHRAESIHETTQGNPLLVVEVLRLMALQHGSIDEGDPAAPLPIPERIQQIAAERLRHLDARCIDVLELAAVAGSEIDAALLAAASERSYAHVLEALDAAAASAMVQEHPGRTGRFRFVHDLVRGAIYRAMPAALRTHRHALIGLALERLYGSSLQRLDELAHHFSHSDPLVYAERALTYRLAAAAHSSSLTAYEDASLHYERALTLGLACAIPQRKLAEIELALGVAQMRAKSLIAGRATLEAATAHALESGSVDALAQAALEVTPHFLEQSTGATDWHNVRMLEAALDAMSAEEPAMRARLLAALSVARGWSDPDSARVLLAQRSLELAERSKDSVALLAARSACQTALLASAAIEERLVEAQAIIRDADRIDDSQTSLVHRYLRLCTLVEAGHPKTADHEMRAFVRLATTLRQPQALWYAQRYTAMRALMEGRFKEAERLGQEFLQVGSILEPENALQSFGAQLAGLYWQTGRAREILPLIEPQARSVDALPSWQATLAFLAAECGEVKLARKILAQVFRTDLSALPRNGHFVITLNILSDACAALGDAERAGELYGLLAPYESQHVCIYAVFYRGSVWRNLGVLSLMLGEHARALEQLEQAVHEERRVDAPPFEALSSYELARALLVGRAPSKASRARAFKLIERALSITRALGMPELERRLSTLGHPQ